MKPGLLAAVLAFAGEVGIDFSALALAWARALPAVALVPVFALRGLPGPLRAMFALLIAVSVLPGLAPPVLDVPWPALLASEALRGLPIGIAMSAPLYALTMTGSLVDHARGGEAALSLPFGDAKGGPIAVLFSMTAGLLFLTTGGPSRLAHAILFAPPATSLSGLVGVILLGLSVALSLGAPLLAASFVVELAFALVAKAAQPAPIQPLVAPLKSAAIMILLATTLPYLLDAATQAFALPLSVP